MMNSAWEEAVAVVFRLSPATILMKLASRLGDVALYGVPAQHLHKLDRCKSMPHVNNEAHCSRMLSQSAWILLETAAATQGLIP